MANEIQELLNEIRDPRLKERLSAAVGELRKTKKFGLVFEEHLPELLPIYSAKIRNHTRVARKDGRLTEIFIVERVAKGIATVKPEHGEAQTQSIPVAELVVVKRFGEAIFPALRHVESVLRGGDSPHHTLIEADNYHALQLLEWLYAGEVDCIYIDPPYNTGARDWKYNNNFVDNNDSYLHSKWLAMMGRRIRIALNLLKHDGVLIVTIDDNEISHLDCLLEPLLSGWTRYVISIEHNKRGRRGKNFAKTNEFALIFVRNGLEVISEELAADTIGGESRNLRRTGSGSLRGQRWRKFYPIYVDADELKVMEIGDSVPLNDKRFSSVPKEVLKKFPKRRIEVVWPLDEEGREKNWHYAVPRARASAAAGQLEVRQQSYGLQIYYTLRQKDSKKYKTVWTGSVLDASTHGTEMLESILGRGAAFDFPKSLYATAECLRAATRERPNALILDFFAGSGTTLHSTALLNAADDGNRQCIIVTNNEVFPEERAKQLKADGHMEGDPEFEQFGICQSVTFPRCKFVINGKRDDGTELSGEYLTGRFEEKEVRRAIRSLDFATCETLASKHAREALALAVGFTKSKVTGDESFLLSEGEQVAVLLELGRLDEFIEQGEEWADAIETVYLPIPAGKAFNEAKAQLTEAWPPLTKSVEIKRSMKEGFAANLDYFRLDFLDRAQVETGGKLADILPALWMMAGCRGKLPTCKGNEKMLFFKNCPFAMLVEESTIKPFLAKLEERPDIDWVFLVTNDQDSFSRMCEWLPEHVPAAQRIHLWRNYVDNFLINVDHAAGEAP